MCEREKKIWAAMLLQSWQPSQWFISGDRPKPDFYFEDKVMWVYKMYAGDDFRVGFYSPNGEWHLHDVYKTKDDAIKAVHYLNGGDSAA